jgi:hypothetical protein
MRASEPTMLHVSQSSSGRFQCLTSMGVLQLEDLRKTFSAEYVTIHVLPTRLSRNNGCRLFHLPGSIFTP